MADSFNKTLYPPLIDSSMPSFDVTTDAKVYFSISPMNAISDIETTMLQFTLVEQRTNKSYLLDATEIQFTDIKNDEKGYYFEIKQVELRKQIWVINNIYKVQIRFTKKGIKYTEGSKATWLSNNLDNFSEWSTVCLIKPIEIPQISRPPLYVTEDLIQFSASLTFNNTNSLDEEYLKQVILYITHSSGFNKTIAILPTAKNEVNEYLPYAFPIGDNYNAKIEYITNNNFSIIQNEDFSIKEHTAGTAISSIKFSCSDLEVDTSVSHSYPEQGFTGPHIGATKTGDGVKEQWDLENARIRIEWDTSTETEGKIIIRRSSSKNLFYYWEDIASVDIQNKVYLDYTVEAGVIYKYRLYVVTGSSTERDGPYKNMKDEDTENTIMIMPDYGYLLGENDQQLKLKFDNQISSFKINVLEGTTQTIGAVYPYIRRNGDSYYKTFPITALITSLADEEKTFISDSLLYDENDTLYQEFFDNNNDIAVNNFIKEKIFREKVMNFLYDAKPKLFRSPTEGNVLVKITDVNLTPKQELGRMIYSFSANATEIDKCDAETLRKYNILREV